MPAINAVGYGGGMNAAWQQSYYASKISAARTAAANPSQPETPVEPVSAVRRVAPDAAVRMPVAVQEPRVPTEADLNNASDNLARMRIQSVETAGAAEESETAEAANAAEEPASAENANDANAAEEPETAEAANAANAAETAAGEQEPNPELIGVHTNLMNPAGVS